jgi:site-specific DNA recombinase
MPHDGAVGYFRVSTKEQAHHNNSLPVQQSKFDAFCRQNKLSSLKTFADAESGRTQERTAFQKMLTYCRTHASQIKCVVVADLSRLARNVGDQANTITDLSQQGIKLLSIDEPNLDDTAAGKLSANIIGAMHQFFSDSLSEKTKFRMKAGVERGRWLWVAPLGYRNDRNTKSVVIDTESAPFVTKAFSMVAAGDYASTDSLLRMLTSLGFRTRKGNPVHKQTFARILSNPFYAGWVVSGDVRVRGNHEPLISQELFDRVQARLAGASNGHVPHKKVNEDFPLKGFVRCANCDKNLTAGWVKGKLEKFAFYWCWNPRCHHKVHVSRERLDVCFSTILAMHPVSGDVLAKLPSLAAATWASRKQTIADAAKQLTRRMTSQTTLNTRLIEAKLKGEISQTDFEMMKTSIDAELAAIERERKSLDTEASTMESLIRKRDEEPVYLAHVWQRATFTQKIEMQRAFFPEGLVFSQEKLFFEHRNTLVMERYSLLFDALVEVGVPDGI